MKLFTHSFPVAFLALSATLAPRDPSPCCGSASPTAGARTASVMDEGGAPEVPAQGAASFPEGAGARAAFERFVGLAGDWAGASTKGWKDACSFEVIARGTVVCQISEFEAHPGETMVTMFHLDGERLMLTHYCVAGNQPRLVATEFSEDGDEITFAFLDGTGLRSRDEGHMDRVVFSFGADGSVTSRWTWYEEGRETWMEEVRIERVPS